MHDLGTVIENTRAAIANGGSPCYHTNSPERGQRGASGVLPAGSAPGNQKTDVAKRQKHPLSRRYRAVPKTQAARCMGQSVWRGVIIHRQWALFSHWYKTNQIVEAE